MRKTVKRILCALLVAIMLIGVMPTVSFGASTPAFSLSIVSETSSEVKISFNLESGSFTAMDWQVNASDWNQEDKTTGLWLSSIEKAQNYKDYVSLHEDDEITPIFALNKNNGKVSFAYGLSSYDVIGSMLIFTFTKSSSAKANVSPSDFFAKITSCTGSDGKLCTPLITFDWGVDGCAHILSHVTVPSTCKVNGIEYDFCTECGETFNEKVLDTLVHTWKEWNITEAPTEEINGTGKRTCSVCGTKEDIELAIKEDKGTGIQLMYQYKRNVSFNVKDETETLGQIIGRGLLTHKLYDITMLLNNQEIQPDGEVDVSIPIPKEYDRERTKIYHVKPDTKEYEEVSSRIIGNESDGYYITFRTNHFSYFAVAEEVGEIYSVSLSDVTMNYKKSMMLNPTINAESNAKYTVKYSSSNTSIARVDDNGNVYAAKRGSATITCTVTDSLGNVVTDTCKVTVKYSFGQWLIKILLFGWIWY